MELSKVLQKRDFGPAGFKWLTLRRITYKDPYGKERIWESAERTTRNGDIDGVAIIARVWSAFEPLQIVLESQFRPPQNNYVIEFPAGLVDARESVEQAALRELKEETGYTGEVVEVTPVCYSDPGMSNANMQYVVVDVDAGAPENQRLAPRLEDGEFIEVFLLPVRDLYHSLLALQKKKGWEVDARLLSYAAGMHQAGMRCQPPGLPPALVHRRTEETLDHAQNGERTPKHVRFAPQHNSFLGLASSTWIALGVGVTAGACAMMLSQQSFRTQQ